VKRRDFLSGGLAAVAVAASSIPALAVVEEIDVVKHNVNLLMHYAVQLHLFEPNDEITRRSIKGFINGHLQVLNDQGVISRFAVMCNDRNNWQEIIDANGVRVDVYVKDGDRDRFFYMEVNSKDVTFEDIDA
jgi:phage tail sheath protein FI